MEMKPHTSSEGRESQASPARAWCENHTPQTGGGSAHTNQLIHPLLRRHLISKCSFGATKNILFAILKKKCILKPQNKQTSD